MRAVGLGNYGTRIVGISGYPEGLLKIASQTLWNILKDKAALLGEQGLNVEIFTQLKLTSGSIPTWIEPVRNMGITAPIRIGVCGPIKPKRLLDYARRVGAAPSTNLIADYGFSLENPLDVVAPDRLIASLALQLDPATHGEVRLPAFALGGLRTTASWIHDSFQD
jgi:methylenetetrahydrofolate reductase (NADPH)